MVFDFTNHSSKQTTNNENDNRTDIKTTNIVSNETLNQITTAYEQCYEVANKVKSAMDQKNIVDAKADATQTNTIDGLHISGTKDSSIDLSQSNVSTADIAIIASVQAIMELEQDDSIKAIVADMLGLTQSADNNTTNDNKEETTNTNTNKTGQESQQTSAFCPRMLERFAAKLFDIERFGERFGGMGRYDGNPWSNQFGGISMTNSGIVQSGGYLGIMTSNGENLPSGVKSAIYRESFAHVPVAAIAAPVVGKFVNKKLSKNEKFMDFSNGRKIIRSTEGEVATIDPTNETNYVDNANYVTNTVDNSNSTGGFMNITNGENVIKQPQNATSTTNYPPNTDKQHTLNRQKPAKITPWFRKHKMNSKSVLNKTEKFTRPLNGRLYNVFGGFPYQNRIKESFFDLGNETTSNIVNNITKNYTSKDTWNETNNKNENIQSYVNSLNQKINNEKEYTKNLENNISASSNILQSNTIKDVSIEDSSKLDIKVSQMNDFKSKVSAAFGNYLSDIQKYQTTLDAESKNKQTNGQSSGSTTGNTNTSKDGNDNTNTTDQKSTQKIISIVAVIVGCVVVIAIVGVIFGILKLSKNHQGAINDAIRNASSALGNGNNVQPVNQPSNALTNERKTPIVEEVE